MQVLAVRSPSIVNNFSTAVSPALPIGLAYIVVAIKDIADFEDLAAHGSLDVMSCHSDHYSKIELQFFKLGGFALFYSISLLLRPYRLWVLFRDLATGPGSTRLSTGLINIFARWRKKRFG